MKKTINLYEFRDEFLTSSSYKNNFSYEGLTALFEYFEEYEESTGEELEFDMVAICCDFTEYENLEEIRGVYPDYFEQYNIETVEDLQDHTQVIQFDSGIIIQDF